MTVTWASQISGMVSQMTVWSVTRMIRQEATMNAAARASACMAVVRSFTVRETGTWNSTAPIVLVANSQASTTRGALVSATSQSGMTVSSSVWCDDSSPSKNEVITKPAFLMAGRPGGTPSATAAGGGASSGWISEGSSFSAAGRIPAGAWLSAG